MGDRKVEDTEDTEDTKSQEDEDTEDTEESSEEEESEDTEESESEEEEATEDTEEESEQYLDLNKLPANLREAGRRMLASHSKAMAKAKSKVEEWKAEQEKELQNTYSAAIVKANGFDKLTNLPQFKQFWSDLENGKPYGFSSDFRKAPKPEPEDDSSDASNGKVTVKAIMEQLEPMIANAVERAVGPIKGKYISDQWDAAEKNLPNFSKYKARVTDAISRHPTLSIEEAFKLVAPGEVVTKKASEAMEIAKRIPKKTLKPGTSGTKPLTEETINDVKDAMRLAQRKLLGASGG